VPVEDIKAKGCKLFNARGVYSTPMAEWALFRVLEKYKKGWFFKVEQEKKCWSKNREVREIYGINVAIIGAGNIGGEVAKRFKALGAVVDGYDIHTNCTPDFDNMILIDAFKQNVDKYDVVILTAPLLPSTKKLISRDILKEMKDDAMIVNISRGGLIDEQALVEVLSDRQNLYAALDVFEEEPLSMDSPLWSLPNVAISPHNSFVSNGNNERMFNVIYSSLKEFMG
jgi:phosphoglycerate dehydrogenase-like enzyme